MKVMSIAVKSRVGHLGKRPKSFQNEGTNGRTTKATNSCILDLFWLHFGRHFNAFWEPKTHLFARETYFGSRKTRFFVRETRFSNPKRLFFSEQETRLFRLFASSFFFQMTPPKRQAPKKAAADQHSIPESC